MLERVIAVVRETGALLVDKFAALSQLEVHSKHEGGLVTDADHAAEALLTSQLAETYPNIGYLAEEDGESSQTGEARWIIDPLDGTSNFASGLPWWSISVALERPCKSGNIELGVIYHPLRDELFWAQKGSGAFCNGAKLSVTARDDFKRSVLATGFYYHTGEQLHQAIEIFERVQNEALAIRRFGSAAIDLAYVAAGRFDAFWEQGLAPWDVAAGHLIIEEAGGKLSRYDGSPASIYAPEHIASNTHLHKSLMSLIADVPPATS